MATTGFWPVKNRLKQVIDYADNPDKTTDRRYLDDDLAAALEYVGNDDKTDQRLFVSAINCPPQRAYECMMATKRRYGKLGGNVAYHGYQSFVSGEVTPEEAHAIGVETAKRMWGDDYEIVVTTHLNTDNLHNHIVVNSVSFRTGRKFENHISDHYRLREISDEICRERGKSVLPPVPFDGSPRKDYWVHRQGGLTHRDILKMDMERIVPMCTSYEDLVYRLKGLGYQIERDYNYAHISVTAKGWKRAVRLDSVGFSDEILRSRLYANQDSMEVYALKSTPAKPKHYPLLSLERQLEFEINHSKDTATVLVDVLFYILLQLLKLEREPQPELHTPDIRSALTFEKKLTGELLFLQENSLHTEAEIMQYFDDTNDKISALEQQRQEIRNRNRRPKTAEERQANNAAARELSQKLKPLRQQQKLAQRTLQRYPQVWYLVSLEHDTERKARERSRDRGR